MAYVKLQTNVPVVGVPKYADVFDSDDPNKDRSFALKGKWEGQDGDRIYMPMACLGMAIQAGIVKVESGDPDTDDTKHVKISVIGSPKVKILKTEDGKKRAVTLTLLEGGGPAQSGRSRQPANEPRGSSGDRSVEDKIREVKQIEATMGQCLKRGVELATANIPGNADAPLSVAMSLFIERMRRGLLSGVPKQAGDKEPSQPESPPTITDEQKSTIDELGAKLGWATPALEAEICRAAGVTNARAITRDQAVKAIAALEVAVQKEEAARKAADDSEIPFSFWWLVPLLMSVAGVMS